MLEAADAPVMMVTPRVHMSESFISSKGLFWEALVVSQSCVFTVSKSLSLFPFITEAAGAM